MPRTMQFWNFLHTNLITEALLCSRSIYCISRFWVSRIWGNNSPMKVCESFGSDLSLEMFVFMLLNCLWDDKRWQEIFYEINSCIACSNWASNCCCRKYSASFVLSIPLSRWLGHSYLHLVAYELQWVFTIHCLTSLLMLLYNSLTRHLWEEYLTGTVELVLLY